MGGRRPGRDDDQGRVGAEDERRYGDYTETDEGDSSVRAGSYDEGRVRYGSRDGREGQRRTSAEERGPRQPGYGSSTYDDPGRGERYGESNRDYGYGRRVDADHGYSGSGRRDFGSDDYGGQYRQSAPGGFGQAQGSSAWRGHGVEEGSGALRGRGRTEPYREGHADYDAGAGFGSESPGSRSAGQHRGKGPKGYQRSDERLKEMICERLREDPQIDASDLSVTVQGGKVTFDGTVDSRQTKNLVEDVAEQFGVEDVQNNLRVQRQGLARLARASLPAAVRNRLRVAATNRGAGATERHKEKMSSARGWGPRRPGQAKVTGWV
jgi:osmotically-inducible protein OsmY